MAFQAGLGWFGKNTCLIDQKKGSLFLIGEIFTSAKLSFPVTLAPDLCGKCNRCVEACPTQAFESPRVLNAKKCISYLTIESKKNPPKDLRAAIGDWLFGCDICQTVCPWNEKSYGKEAMQKELKRTDADTVLEELKWILNSSEEDIKKAFANTPLLRRKAKGLKRNAIVVAANLKVKALAPDIRSLSSLDQDFKELCSWALEVLESPTE